MRSRNHFLFLLIAILNIKGLAFSQDCRIQSLNVKDGLTMGYISALMEDKNKFIWIGTYFGLNRYDGRRITQYKPDHFDPWGLHANVIFSISEDENGFLWLGTEKGLVVMDPVTERFLLLSEIDNQIPGFRIKKVFCTPSGRLYALQEDNTSQWILELNNLIELKDCIGKSIRKLPKLKVRKISLPQKFAGKVKLFYPTDQSFILIKDEKNVTYRYLENSKEVVPIDGDLNLSVSYNMTGLIRKSGGKYGLFMQKEGDRDNMDSELRSEIIFVDNQPAWITQFYETKIWRYQPDGIKGSNEILAFCEIGQPFSGVELIDSKNNIWLGTTGFGVRIVSNTPLSIPILGQGKSFYNLTALPGNNIWPGYFHSDIILSGKTEKFQQAPWQNALKESEKVISVCNSRQRRICFLIVQNSETNSLYLKEFDWKTNRMSNRQYALKNNSTAPPVQKEDYEGNIWISGVKGELIRFRPSTGDFSHIPLNDYFPDHILNELISWDILQSLNDEIWVANSFGLLKIQHINTVPKITSYYNSDKRIIFRNDGIFSILQDEKDPNIIWLGTLGNGLASFDKKLEKVTYFNSQEKQNFNIIASMQSTDNLLWLTTDFDLACFDKTTKNFISIKEYDVKKNFDFNVMASAKLEDGRIAFGTSNGLIVFKPEDLLYPENERKVHLISAEVDGLGIRQLIEKKMLETDNENNYHFRLKHNQNTISLVFGSPSSLHSSNILFEYRLHAFDTTWHRMYDGHILPLTDISPGNYNLEVRTVNSKSKHPQNLMIFLQVLPPWYSSTFAIVFYIALLLATLFFIFRYEKKRIHILYESRLYKSEVNNLKTLGNLKNRFITYLAHEFKTPLALISGLIDSMQNSNNRVNHQLIRHEAENMLRIIDELLDLSKLNSGNIKLNYVNGDIHQFIKDICASLDSWCKNKNITLIYNFTQEELLTRFDPFRLKYVLNNILLNALRFSNQNERIIISTHQTFDKYAISITDFGKGFKPESLPYIFEAYYQENDQKNEPYTYGLGLSFVKELIQIFGGTIKAISEPDVKTEFIITLPFLTHEEGLPNYDLSNYNGHTDLSSEEFGGNMDALDDNKPICLIVEDHPEMQNLLQSKLTPYFRTIVASNGEEGLSMAIAEIPDVILTDIIMPVMDGYKMTNHIKANPLTSHIPVVMLSSLGNIEDRIKGQREGAEIYISKPFHQQELLLQLFNLIKLQENWKRRYRQIQKNYETIEKNISDANLEDVFGLESIESTDEFMKSLISLFEMNFDSESLDSDEIAKMLHVSRPQLYRKIAAVSDISVMELLKNFRLEKATQLMLSDPSKSMKEVAFKCGFKERTHFTKSFILKYKMTPSEWKNQNL